MTQTLEARFGPVEAVYGECDCDPPEHVLHTLDCASRTVVAFTRKRYVRCCDENEVGDNPTIVCPRCADSPLPGRVPEPCGNCEGIGDCGFCENSGHVTETMSRERYAVLVWLALARHHVESAFRAWSGVSHDERRFALAIHESGVLR